MPSSGLKGPHALDEKTIDEIITKKSPGAYIIVYTKEKTFYVLYVGRSDKDLNKRLKEHIDEKEKYKQFKYDYYDSAKAAYEKECKLWHDFGGPEGKLDNKNHPDKPEGSNWKCPVCGK